MRLIQRIKALWKAVTYAAANFRRLESAVKDLENEIRKRTRIGVDLGATPHHINFAVVVGTFQGRDYVEVVRMEQQAFNGICQQLREMKRHGHVQTIDAPPVMRAVLSREGF